MIISACKKGANRVLNNAADNLAKQLGSCRLSYTVTLNRPTVVGILLKAENGANTVYKGVNIDLTTGREMALTEIFPRRRNLYQHYRPL